MTDNQPDFDSMSPEQLMAWMESLAKRQGAHEGFTTSADMEVAEVDPNSVQLEEPGYIPYGMDQAKWEQKQEEERRKKAERLASQPAAPPPAPQPVQAPPPAQPAPAAQPAASAQPDFDSMSPEQLMAWMESLAKRQGAHEGFTTAADMEVAEVDEASVKIEGPGYIPYGMDQAKWEQKQEEERRKKAERQAAAQQPPAAQAQPVPEPVQEQSPLEWLENMAAGADEPAPAPAAQPAASAQPDFDSMSPEQLMAWMESLAKRQGAHEGFTTAADMEVAEVDEASVKIEGPGYIPYGMDQAKWEQKQEEERRKKAERQAASQAPQPVAQTPPPAPVEEPAAADDGLGWLAALSGDQGADSGLPQLDLSGLGQPLAENTPTDDDPLAWLQGLAQSQGSNSLPGLESFSLDDLNFPPAETAPAAQMPSASESDNPLEWLESLAKRQGADEEELVTNADLDIPLPDIPPAQTGPGYRDFSFEAPMNDEGDTFDFLNMADEDDMEFETDSDQLEDPSAWLDKLASGQGTDEPAKKVDVTDALSKGADIPHDEMKNWMDQLLEQGAKRSDVPDYIEEENAEIVQAELPDWLIEQVGAPPTAQPEAKSEAALIEDIIEPPEVDMPDWLRDDIQENEEFDFNTIFEAPAQAAPVAEAPPVPAAATPHSITTELEIDPNDPWVEAFEMERRMGRLDVDKVPEWYSAKLAGHPVEQEVPESDIIADELLAEANLPEESELVMGQVQDVPGWMKGFEIPAAPVKPAARPAVEIVEEPAVVAGDIPDWLSATLDEPEDSEDLPDWLREAGIEEPQQVPDWLKETLGTGEAEIIPTAEETFVPSAPAASPAPIPAPAAAVNVSQALESARTRFRSGDIEGSLSDYESIIRANAQLDAVINDLNSLTRDENQKKNPAVYRVLGDGLMRQGKLQEALDTYRKALNLL